MLVGLVPAGDVLKHLLRTLNSLDHSLSSQSMQIVQERVLLTFKQQERTECSWKKRNPYRVGNSTRPKRLVDGRKHAFGGLAFSYRASDAGDCARIILGAIGQLGYNVSGKLFRLLNHPFFCLIHSILSWGSEGPPANHHHHIGRNGLAPLSANRFEQSSYQLVADWFSGIFIQLRALVLLV